MKKIFFFSVTLGLSLFGLFGCDAQNAGSVNAGNRAGANTSSPGNTPTTGNTTNVNNQPTANTGTTGVDSVFMNEAAQGGMAEVELGQMAASKAQNAEVKQFGEKMVADHTKANNELKELAGRLAVTLPTEPNPKQKETKERLSKLSGAEFDKEYVKVQVEDHEKTVALFEKEAASGTKSETKAFAAKSLPTLKMHLEMIRGLSNKIK
jgi:putative membrane protein